MQGKAWSFTVMVIHEPGRHRNPSGFQDSGLNCQVNSTIVADCFPLISFPFICFCSICVTNPHLSILLAIGLRHMQRVTPPAWKKRFRYQTVYHAIGYRIALCSYKTSVCAKCRCRSWLRWASLMIWWEVPWRVSTATRTWLSKSSALAESPILY